MIEQTFALSRGNDKAVEKIIFDENIHYLHMVFNTNEGLPEHFSNSNVYMTVVSGLPPIVVPKRELVNADFRHENLCYCLAVS